MTQPVEPSVGSDDPVRVHVSGNAIALAATCLGLAATLLVWPEAPRVVAFLFVLSGWAISVVAHEFGHAFVAWKAGDHTVAEKGYLSLDPLKYGDVVTSLAVPALALFLGGIGFPGGAVYLRPDLMRRPWQRSAASLAGPAMTFAVLLLAALLLALTPRDSAVAAPFALLAFLQATALILNLLPIPGLDGYGAIRPFLPAAVLSALRPFERFGLLILFLLLFAVADVSQAIFLPALHLCRSLGIDIDLIRDGWRQFAFWKT